MPTVAVYDIANNQVGDIELNENIFGVEMNAGLVHQAVVMQLASQRLGTHAGFERILPVRQFQHLVCHRLSSDKKVNNALYWRQVRHLF